MAYEAWWSVEHRILQVRCSQAITLDDLCDIERLWHESGSDAHLVIDFSSVTAFPIDLINTTSAACDSAEHTNTGQVMIAGAPRMLCFQSELIQSIWQTLPRCCETIHEAYVILAQQDKTLSLSVFPPQTTFTPDAAVAV